MHLLAVETVAFEESVSGVIGELHCIDRIDVKPEQLQWECRRLVSYVAKHHGRLYTKDPAGHDELGFRKTAVLDSQRDVPVQDPTGKLHP